MCAKELWPVREAAKAIAPTGKWKGKLVKFGLDNQSATFSMCASRSGSEASRQLMRDLGDLQQQYEFDAIGQWVPREMNVVADLLSRQFTLDGALAAAAAA